MIIDTIIIAKGFAGIKQTPSSHHEALAALAALSFHIIQGRRLQTDTTYTPEECDVWFAGGSAFDADGSGGLSLD
jgi:hypothetical protein